jgi:hypothetical protein
MSIKEAKHGGKRKGAGRKPGSFPAFTKKFRATEAERAELAKYMTGDAREDFLNVLTAFQSLTRILREYSK